MRLGPQVGPYAGHSASGLETQIACPQTPGGFIAPMTTTAADTRIRSTATRARMNRRQKVAFTDDELARLRLAAKGAGIKASQFIHRAVVSQLSESGAKPGASTGAPVPLSDAQAHLKRKFRLTPDDAERLRSAAKAAGLHQHEYVRSAVMASITGVPGPRPKKTAATNHLAVEIARLAFQVGKLGNNVNQLARQANTGLVPLTRAEIEYFNNMQQRLLTLATAAIEKVLE